MPSPSANYAADKTGAVFVVTYVEAMPGRAAAALDVLRRIRDAARRGAGNLRCDLLQRLAQSNQFVALDTWQNEADWTAHATGPPFDQLQRLLLSPCDVRIHSGFAVGPPGGSPAEDGSAATLYAVTHVDVVPPHKDEGVELLAQLFEASRREAGNVGFEVLQQTGRPNHLTVVETWRDEAAFDAHTMTAPVKQFREKLAPLSGALYDQRLFRAVR